LGRDLVQEVSDRVTDRTSKDRHLSNLLDRVGHKEGVRHAFVKPLDGYKREVESASFDEFMDEARSFPEYEPLKVAFLEIGRFSVFFEVLGWEASETERQRK